jgi:hypothetical protein
MMVIWWVQMDVRELISHLQKIRCWTPQNSMVRNLVDELINHFKSQLPQ